MEWLSNSGPLKLKRKILSVRSGAQALVMCVYVKGSVKEPNILIYFFFLPITQSVFSFRCSVYWWKGSVRFYCFKILLV